MTLGPGSAYRSQCPVMIFFSVNGNITPRRKRVTCPVLDDTTI